MDLVTTELQVLNWAPDEEQMRAKAAFWDAAQGHWKPVESLTQAEVVRMSGARSGSMARWLTQPEFVAWFYNKNAAKHRVMAAAEAAVDALMETLRSDDPKMAGAKVRAAELILNYSGMQPVKKVEHSQTPVQAMTPEQLKELLAAHLAPLLSSMTPDEVRKLLGPAAVSLLQES